MIAVITSDIELLEVFYAHTISPIVIAVLFSIILCLFIGSFHPVLGILALLAYITVGAVLPILASRLSKDTGLQFRIQSGNLSAFVLDSLRGLSETQQYGDGEKRLAMLKEQTMALSQNEEKMKRLSGSSQAVVNTVILFFDLTMLFVSAMLYQNGQVAFIGVLIPTIALMSSFGPVVALANLGTTLQNTFAAGNRVLDILDETPAVEEVTDRKEIDFSGAKASSVTFAYRKEKPSSVTSAYGEQKPSEEKGEAILENVSVDIPKGSIVGICGKSGSGKSTLLKLFMRFWETQKGNIQLSGTDINQINTENLRNMESLVTQETQLFHDSIRNNLCIAKLDATQEELETACKKASVHDFILSLPKGYDTPVGELGDTLSGGERQRLGLARAFLHNADFLLLDEPTSNLDSLNEAVILKALKEEQEQKTVVLVSHRPSTMRITDKVYSVEHGRVS